MAGFGDKKVGVSNSGADVEIILDGGGDGAVNGNCTRAIIFQRTDVNFVFPDVFYVQIGQLGNAHPGLQKQLDNGGHSDIQADRVTQRCVFGRGKNAGGRGCVFRVG
ncbi:MAG: hypothetical protein UX99_C0020G0016 [Candidatus Amesbacteria bacterium GW2011_GWB1_47_26]|uniref:Uncharacterized protein n=1 Tax=Candidatus Amesbacteria bacterium GW2011_GWC2_45_19 TaxID=1618366 RepID=A0A0G1M3L5_9BACT|nr:MAG: hypothetical protein UX05_C0006G0024 [Candidatus Amesbacteria bacterium GW2011_GWC2_45_19]KKU68262.1 MAG: hypothetical protein UX93_C0009G0036 [Microgenomates group bacterium GW2011_GWC1_47_20]KKU74247.1 MAG: hypothetical protein UX99_C0020G0016 [Candidatus Amesbacteria bacterium GW2011_GWB1_47_26]